MIEIQDGSANLAKVNSGVISKPEKPITIGQLELELLKRYPREDAEPWDRTGMLVGDPSALVEGVAVALDVTASAIAAAKRAGANVLLTHHPVFLDAPSTISPSHEAADVSGVNVYKAVEAGVALINFHTALDVSADALRLFPEMLSLDFERLLVTRQSDPKKGYGQFCRVRENERPLKLAHLAARCLSVFGHAPRVWGDAETKIETVAIANGAAGSVVSACHDAHVDCLVCGEVKYHAALDASQAGLSIVELGHDVSELPLAAVLAQAAIDAGVPASAVTLVDQSSNWSIPDSTRI